MFNRNPVEKRVRDRLINLINTDTIRLNDKHFIQTLSDQIEEINQSKHYQILDRLEENERQRELDLKLRGLISKTHDNELKEKYYSKFK
jgi:hypothetical protein